MRDVRMDGGLHYPGGVNRLLSIVWIAEIIVILGSAAVLAVTSAQQLLKTRAARRDIYILMGIGDFNWRMDHGLRCPPDAAAIARHLGFGPLVDPWGTRYQLACVEGEGAQVFSAGPDRVARTGDDVHLDAPGR